MDASGQTVLKAGQQTDIGVVPCKSVIERTGEPN